MRMYKHKIFQFSSRENSCWEKPPLGYVRVDVDGSKDIQAQGACGGTVRDSSGKWILGFQQHIGHCLFSTMAEIYAIKAGLQICRTRGFTKVKLYSDSLEAIHLLLQDHGPFHPLSDVITDVRQLIYSHWEVEINHAYRESIMEADYLARTAYGPNKELFVLQNPPAFCSSQKLAGIG